MQRYAPDYALLEDRVMFSASPLPVEVLPGGDADVFDGAVGTSVATGIVIWLLRGSFLVASLLSSLPAWNFIDPISILDEARNASDGGDDESLETIIDKAEQRTRDANRDLHTESGA